MDSDVQASLVTENHELKTCLKELLEIRRIQGLKTYDPRYELRVNKAWDAAEQLVKE